MHPKYEDILNLASQAGVEPVWWDENGVPRFRPFRPEDLGVYDYFAALGEIECSAQYCRRGFLVGVGLPKQTFTLTRFVTNSIDSVIDAIECYGDPPRHTTPDGGTCAGETMVSDMVRIVGVWVRDDGLEWVPVKRP